MPQCSGCRHTRQHAITPRPPSKAAISPFGYQHVSPIWSLAAYPQPSIWIPWALAGTMFLASGISTLFFVCPSTIHIPLASLCPVLLAVRVSLSESERPRPFFQSHTVIPREGTHYRIYTLRAFSIFAPRRQELEHLTSRGQRIRRLHRTDQNGGKPIRSSSALAQN